MSIWLSGVLGIVILFAAFLCRNNKRLQNFRSAAILCGCLFLLNAVFSAVRLLGQG